MAHMSKSDEKAWAELTSRLHAERFGREPLYSPTPQGMQNLLFPPKPPIKNVLPEEAFVPRMPGHASPSRHLVREIYPLLNKVPNAARTEFEYVLAAGASNLERLNERLAESKADASPMIGDTTEEALRDPRNHPDTRHVHLEDADQAMLSALTAHQSQKPPEDTQLEGRKAFVRQYLRDRLPHLKPPVPSKTDEPVAPMFGDATDPDYRPSSPVIGDATDPDYCPDSPLPPPEPEVIRTEPEFTFESRRHIEQQFLQLVDERKRAISGRLKSERESIDTFMHANWEEMLQEMRKTDPPQYVLPPGHWLTNLLPESRTYLIGTYNIGIITCSRFPKLYPLN